MPLISVVVPVYNVEKYLERCLDSIVNQTFKDLEIILVDDGSTDESGKICDRYAEKDDRIKVIHKVNGGVSSARNVAFEAAKGTYIGSVDGDDYIEPDMYEALLYILKRDKTDLVSCGYYDVYKHGKYPYYEKEEEYIWTNSEFYRNILLERIVTGSMGTKLMKADIVKAIKYQEGKIYEDAMFITSLVQNIKKVSVVTKPFYYYIHRASSITTSCYSPKDLDVIEAFEMHQRLVKNKFPELEMEAAFALDSAYLRVLDKMLQEKNYTSIQKYQEIVTHIKKRVSAIRRNPYFMKTRRIAVSTLSIHVSIYRIFLLLHEKHDKAWV